MALPTNVDSTYADDGSDASVKLHQQHHDTVHGAVNALAGGTAGQVLQKTSSADYAASWQTPVGNFRRPSNLGYLGWNFDPSMANTNNIGPNTGQAFGQKLWLPDTTTVTNILAWVSGAGSGLTSSQNFAGIYTAAGSTLTLVASTGDQTTAWGSTGLKVMALTAPTSITPGDGGAVYVVFLENFATTKASFIGFNQNSSTYNIGAITDVLQWSKSSQGTSLPATINIASSTFANVALPWVALS